MGQRWIGGEFAYVSREKAETLSANLARPGDVIFTQRGTLGQVSLVPNKSYECYLISQSQMKLTVDFKRADPLFLYYVFRTPEQQEHIQSHAIQTGVPHTNLGILRSTVVPAPPLAKQKAIARILGSLDDKIELNHRTNETLEAMARALFRSWFVDFDLVCASAVGRAAQGLAPDIAALFPDAFDHDEMPSGWHLGQLSDIATVVMGASPPGETYNDLGTGVPLVNGPVEYGDFFVEKKKWTTQPTRLSCKGDLILCVRGSTTGRHAFADDEYCLGRGVCAIRALRSAQALVNRLVLDGLPELLAKTTGSVFPNLSSDDIKSFRVVVPPLPIVKLFCDLIAPLDQRVWNNVSERRTLSKLRDLLLPKLISGELRVRDAETLIEKVA
jgi:type I restriction enzyme S subunit